MRRVEALVDLAPPYIAAGLRLIDDEFVGYRAPGMQAGAHDQRAIGGKPALVSADRVGDELRRGEVGVHARRRDHARAAQRRAAMACKLRRLVLGRQLRLGVHRVSPLKGFIIVVRPGPGSPTPHARRRRRTPVQQRQA